MSEPGPDDKDQLWSEATAWFARMRSPDAETFRPEFEEWLGRGALHRRYYNRASEHWVDSGPALLEQSAPNRGRDVEEHAVQTETRGKRGVVAVFAASCLLVGSSATLWLIHEREWSGPNSSSLARSEERVAQSQFATAAGEQRSVRLADGSVIRLGGGTALRATLTPRMRRLDLYLGAARFAVAHEIRPFVVLAGGGSVTAHGTLFDVGVTPDRRVSVRLISGSVDVRFPAAAKRADRLPPRRLSPGEAVSFEAKVAQAYDQAPFVPVQHPAETARDYREVRLADIASEANRHAAVPIRFADPATGAKIVSGRFRIDDTAVLANRLAALFDLVIDRSSGSEILLRSR